MPPGKRFQTLYASYAEHDWKWLKETLLFGALSCFTIGVVFVIVSGPALLFFGLSGAIVATQTPALARQFDAAELTLRKVRRKLRSRRVERARPVAVPLVTEPPHEQRPHPVAVPLVTAPPREIDTLPLVTPVSRTRESEPRYVRVSAQRAAPH